MSAYFFLLLPCFVSLFWGITLLCNAGKNYKAQNILAVSLILLSVTFYIHAHYFAFDGDYKVRYIEDIIFSFAAPSVFPLYILYFRLITNENKPGLLYYLLFLPALAMGMLTITGYLFMGEEKSVIYAHYVLFDHSVSIANTDPLFQIQYLISVKIFNYIFLLQTIYATIYAFVSLSKYKHRLQEFYTEIEGKSLNNNYFFLICMVFFSILTLITGIISKKVFADYIEIIYFAYTVTIYVLARCGYNLKYTAEDLGRILRQSDAEYVKSGAIPIEIEIQEDISSEKKSYNPKLILTFNQLMDDEKIYLQSDLRLDEVARRMRTNRCYISRLINEQFNCTFSDYINRRRIAYAQELIRENPSTLQETLSEKSGFLYLSSFSRTFKRYTGMTPGEWAKSL